jgi:hypothetical protein
MKINIKMNSILRICPAHSSEEPFILTLVSTPPQTSRAWKRQVVSFTEGE